MKSLRQQLVGAVKAAGRELLPPIFSRAIKSVMSSAGRSEHGLSIKTRGDSWTALNSGATIQHRGSLADIGVIDQIFLARDYDLSAFKRSGEIADFYEACEAPLILDCGANIGASALWFTSVYPKAVVCAVEPERLNFELLKLNCADSKVMPVHGAVAAEAGTLQLHDPGEGEWGFRTIAGNDNTKLYDVPAFSVANLLAMQPGQPFILKIDIEGAEENLFGSGGDVIDRFPVVIIELHDWMLPHSASSRPFLQWHASRDRDFVYRGENVFSFSNTSLYERGICA